MGDNRARRIGGKVMEKRHSPTYWRDRADEMRSIAETFDNVDTKRVLLDIAADFDQLAKLPVADISKAIGARAKLN
jgi:hypothetical protein